jgi:hypothetical protein
VCSWAFPDKYKSIIIDDTNKELIRRDAEKQSMHQSELANKILQEHFNRKR